MSQERITRRYDLLYNFILSLMYACWVYRVFGLGNFATFKKVRATRSQNSGTGGAAAPSRRSFLGFTPWREHRNIGNAFLSFRRLTEIPWSSVPCQICYCFAYLLEINSYKTHPEGQGKHASYFLPIYHLKPIQIKGTANTHCFTHYFLHTK